MNEWQLIVHENEDCLHELEGKVRQVLKQLIARNVSIAVNVATARNIEAARRLLENDNNHARDCGLLVIGSNVPAGPKTSVGSSTSEATCYFVQEMRRAHAALPVAILGRPEDVVMAGFAMGLGPRAAHVLEGQGFLDDIGARVEALLGSEAPRLKEVLDLDIALDAGMSNWSMKRRGRMRLDDSGQIYIDGIKLNQIVEKSESLADCTGAKFSKELKNLADDLNALLFGTGGNNFQLWAKFVAQRADVGGMRQTRIHFTVNRQATPVLVEALKGYTDAEYWALDAPIFRRYASVPTSRFPLFKDRESRRGPINCLLVAADPAEGTISNGGELDASGEVWDAFIPELTHAVDEVRSIEQTLLKACSFGVNPPKVLELGKEEDPRRALEEQLEKDWHLVHFAGHGVVSKGGTSGLVLFAESGGVMPIGDLAKKMLKTQFFFISSCRSGETASVLPALEGLVPAVTGFRWRVDDASASEFAKEFYRALFDRSELSFKYIEYAFLKARRKRYKSSSQDPVWVNPVLVMQLADAESELEAPDR